MIEMKPASPDQEPSAQAKDLVVFDILRDSQCAACRTELPVASSCSWKATGRYAWAAPISTT